MNDSIHTVINPLEAMVLMAVGVLIFVIILKTLKEMALFRGQTVVVVAVCVTLLCLLGMNDFLGNRGIPLPGTPAPAAGSTGDRDFHIPLLLIPYAALGLSILALLLLMSIGRFFRSTQQHRPANKMDPNTLRTNTHPKTDYDCRFEANSKSESWDRDNQDDNSPGKGVR
jgi:hypothetical protein